MHDTSLLGRVPRSVAFTFHTRGAIAPLRSQGMAVGEASYVAEPLVLGNLTGNEFTVTLRDLRALPPAEAGGSGSGGGGAAVAAGGDAAESPEALEARARAAVAALRGSGFINYFGLQRFGAASGARTHVVGAALLRGDWTAAVDLILAPRADEARERLLSSRQLHCSQSSAALRPKMHLTLRAILLFGALSPRRRGRLRRHALSGRRPATRPRRSG